MPCGRLGRVSWAVLGVGCVLALAVLWPLPAAALRSNLGWLALSRATTGQPGADARWAPRAAAHLARARALAPLWDRVCWAHGLALAYEGRAEEALATWESTLEGGAQLLYLGRKEADAGHKALALLLYRGAALAQGEEAARGHVLAQSICQQYVADAMPLDLAGQTYCEAWQAAQSGSVLVNGQFDEGALAWGLDLGQERPGALSFGATEGFPPPSALLTTAHPAGRAALMQRITVPAGTALQVSGRFRLELAPGARARMLVIEPVDGHTATKTGKVVKESTPWQELTVAYRASDRPGDVRFYPAILAGRGSVWIDDLRVTLSPQP